MTGTRIHAEIDACALLWECTLPHFILCIIMKDKSSYNLSKNIVTFIAVLEFVITTVAIIQNMSVCKQIVS